MGKLEVPNRFKIFVCCLLAVMVAFPIMLMSMYFIGRWGVAFGTEMFSGRCVGFFASIFGCIFFIFFFNESSGRISILALLFTASLFFFSLFQASHPMMKAYLIGLKHAVFNAAPPEQWVALIKIAEEYRMTHPGEHHWDNQLNSNFVRNIYPDKYAFTSFLDNDAQTNDLHLFINWRGASFEPAVQIGKLTDHAPELSELQIFYQDDYSNCITFMLLK